MTTFSGMVAKIENDILRTDLTSDVEREINRAIKKYGATPVWFSSTSKNFATASGQWTYDSADGFPSDIREISYVRLNQSPGTINTDSGAADAYVVDPSTAVTSLTDGLKVVFTAGNSNTGASTLNVSSLGATSITRPNGVALQSGDIVASQVITVVYSSTDSAFHLRDTTGNYWELEEVNIDKIVEWNGNDNKGMPLNYAIFDSKIWFYPVPDNQYVVTIYYDKFYAPLTAADDTNDFTTNYETESLIENEAKYHLYSEIILDTEQAAVCKANVKEALTTIRKITKNYNGVQGRIRANAS